MKKSLLIISFFSLFLFSKMNAQIANNNFENWKIDTFYFAQGTIGNLPADTTVFNDPIGWTSSNVLTKLDSTGSKALVVQSPNSYRGTSALQLTTDTILLPVINNLPFTKVHLPGFAVNGTFDLSAISLGSVSVISPISITGCGQPISQRLSSINGYYNYTPVFNTNTQSNDTCIVWATLRKGDKVVADAVFKSTASTGTYQPFAANFNYYSCEVPDTLAILIASSVPNVYTFIGGANGLQRGSQLLVDSIYYNVLPGNFSFAPFAKNDLVTGYKNITSSFNVLANDTDCSGTPLTVSLLTNPHHGTASVISNQVSYTPTTNFLGLDSIYYKDTNLSGDTATALLIIFVSQNLSGISEVNQISLSVYPVPASNEITIHLENADKYEANIYDVVGNLMQSLTIYQNDSRVSLDTFANGLYTLQLVNEKKAVLARKKFIVNK